MYLELLDNRGVDIKELAAEYLGKKLKQPKNMMYVKMMNSGKSEDIYYYDVTTPKDFRLETTRHCFDDFGYMNSYEDGEVLQGDFDPEWFLLVYREIKKLFAKDSEEYLDKARATLKASKDIEEAQYHAEYMEECKKAEEKLDEKVQTLQTNYNNNILLLNNLDKRLLEEQQQ